MNRSLIVLFANVCVFACSYASHLKIADTYSLYTDGSYDDMKAMILNNPDHINLYDSKGGFPLLRICGAHKTLTPDQSVELVELLIQKGAQVNKQHEKTGKSALHIAASFNQRDIIKKLINAGAFIDIRTNGGLTPLMYASCFEGNADTIKLLAKYGANINARTNKDKMLTSGGRETALHLASQEALFDNMQALLLCGANKDALTLNGASSKNCLESAFDFRKITPTTLEKAINALNEENINQVIAKLKNLKIDNTLYEAINENDKNKIISILSEGKLGEDALNIAFQQSLEQGHLDHIQLFKKWLNKENMAQVIQNRIKKLQKIMNENSELEEDEAISSLISSLKSYFIEVNFNYSNKGITDNEIAHSIRAPRPLSVKDLNDNLAQAITDLEKKQAIFKVSNLNVSKNQLTLKGVTDLIENILNTKELEDLEAIDLSYNKIRDWRSNQTSKQSELYLNFEKKLIELLLRKSLKSINLTVNYLGLDWYKYLYDKLQNDNHGELVQKIIL